MFFRKLLSSLALAGALVSGSAFADVFGVWSTGAGETGGYLHVSVEGCGDKVCGTILRAFNEKGEEDPAYENLGKQMIWNMKEKGENHWASGKIWAPDTDKTYRSKMSLSGDELKVSGCVLGGLICRSMDWKRVE